MKIFRTQLDTLVRAGIKLAMLTGVAFTVTACYGVPPEVRHWSEDPDFQSDTQKIEQQLVAKGLEDEGLEN